MLALAGRNDSLDDVFRILFGERSRPLFASRSRSKKPKSRRFGTSCGGAVARPRPFVVIDSVLESRAHVFLNQMSFNIK